MLSRTALNRLLQLPSYGFLNSNASAPSTPLHCRHTPSDVSLVGGCRFCIFIISALQFGRNLLSQPPQSKRSRPLQQPKFKVACATLPSSSLHGWTMETFIPLPQWRQGLQNQLCSTEWSRPMPSKQVPPRQPANSSRHCSCRI